MKNRDKHFKLQVVSVFPFCKNYLWTYNRVNREGNANERCHKCGDVCLQKGVRFCHICSLYPVYLYIANIVILT